jgi:chromate transporter
MLLSLLAVGGATATAPDMQRYLVQERSWMTASDFTAAVAIAQSAPGHNILFVAEEGHGQCRGDGAAEEAAGPGVHQHRHLGQAISGLASCLEVPGKTATAECQGPS